MLVECMISFFPFDSIQKDHLLTVGVRFRWAVCQIDELKKCLNLPMLRKQLKSLPATLPQTYERILLNIEQNYSHYVLKVLQWLTYSRYPLSLLQLAEVVAIDKEEDPRFDPERRFPEPKDILLICSSLVTATEEEEDVCNGAFHKGAIVRTSTVKLAHFSVKEYLLSSHIIDGPARKYSIQEIDANVCIAKDCLSYILYFTDDLRKPANCGIFALEETFPLIDYAARQWLEHAREGGQINEESMIDLIMELFTSDGASYRSQLVESGLVNTSETPLYSVSEDGLLGVARRLITMGVDVNACSGFYGNALCVASKEGHTEIVRLLLEKGADPNALCAASHRGHTEIVKILLEKGAEPNALDHGWEHGSALYCASGRGYDAIVRLLLDAGAVVGLEEHAGYFSALHAAASVGNTSIVAMLISSGMDVNLSAGKPWDPQNTALSVASGQGHEKVVEALIEAGADTDSKNAALHIASRRGSDGVVKVLLGAGATVNQGWELTSPLREAVANCHLTTVEVLLDAGADVNLGGSWNRGSFAGWATLGRSREVIDLLAAAGAEIICQGKVIRSGEEMMEQLKDNIQLEYEA